MEHFHLGRVSYWTGLIQTVPFRLSWSSLSKTPSGVAPDPLLFSPTPCPRVCWGSYPPVPCHDPKPQKEVGEGDTTEPQFNNREQKPDAGG